MLPSSQRRGDAYARLAALCQEVLGQRRLILVSNRGPVEYRLNEDGTLRVSRGSGGVVSAVSSICQYLDVTWIACAMGEGDRRAMSQSADGRLQVTLPAQRLSLCFISPPRNVYHKYYNIFCNPLLWFLQHYMWNLSHSPNIDDKVYDAWENGYVAVNKAFANAVIKEAAGDELPPLVMLHDYHLYLVGGYIRSQLPDAIVQHFTHIPWPDPGYWRLLPSPMRNAILQSLCAVDIVGLQTGRDVHNFLHCCERFVPDAKVDYQGQTVSLKEHQTRVTAYPVSIDVASLSRIARSTVVRSYEEKLAPSFAQQNIVRVDRAEPSKNILRGLRAIAMLLERHPELVAKVKLLCFLVPSRTSIRQYQRYTQEVFALVEEINASYGKEGYQPIKVYYENNYPQAIAGMRHYDVLVVNAVIDGMNLVAKEGPIVNTRDGVLILSDAVGAHEQLGESALSVAPADLEGTCQALYRALTMEPEERKRRASALKRAIWAEDSVAWICRQFEDLKELIDDRSQLRSRSTSATPFRMRSA